ncbi:LptF/LptG family permease [soil metagenome]|jgi:lipopolysaccharide export system permease protein|nr:LptF/LptG family permease [Deinococcota bacterium]
MKRLDRYLLGESLPPFLFGLLLYSSLIVLSATLPRVEWIVGAPLRELMSWLLLQLPAAMVQTLPVAVLLAVLLAFGRLATSNELLPVQAGGVALGRLTRVFLVGGLLAAAAALYLSERVLPETNARVAGLWWQLSSGGSGLFRLAGQNVALGDYQLHFGATDRRSDDLLDVRLEAWEERTLTVFHAARARFEGASLLLYGYELTVLDLAALDLAALEPSAGGAEETLRRLLLVRSRAPSAESSLEITTSQSLDELISRYGGGGFEDSRSVMDALRDSRDPRLSAGERRQAAVLFHRRLAEPLANLTLILVAVPLAVLYARSRSVAFGLSLVVTLVWYLFLAVGQLLAQTGALPVWLGLWLGNLVLGAFGLYLLAFRISLR